MSSVFSLRLFGALEARANGAALSGLHLREGERLLAYLALHPNDPHTYRKLAQLFWPSEAHQNEEYDGGSYPSTRQAIYSLRRALGDQAWRLSSPGKGVVSFDLSNANVDLLEFERLVQGEDAAGWRRAVELHCAPLLEGWHESWVKEARVRSQRSYDRITAKLRALGPEANITDTSAPARPEAERPVQTSPLKVEAVGGAVPLNSPFYMERDTDREFHQAIARQDSIVLVKGARQIGKTSLLARGLQQARQAGARVLLTDFQSLDEASLISTDALYRTLAQEIADQLNLDVAPEDVWNAKRSAGRNLERYLCDAALGTSGETLVWGLDEADRLFGYACSNEAFGLFRSWHNRRALDPSGPWSRLTLAIAYATEAHLFITDQNQSPFNVGTRLALADFTPAQVAELNQRHGSPLRSAGELKSFYALVGGHPYLTRCGLAALAAPMLEMQALENVAVQEDGPFGDHLRRLRTALLQDAELTEMMRKVLRREPGLTLEGFYRLRSVGLIAGKDAQDARPRCHLYALYFARHLSAG